MRKSGCKMEMFTALTIRENFSFEMLFIWPEKTEWQLQKAATITTIVRAIDD